MPAPLIYWEPSNIPSEIQSELNRRKVNRGFKYIGNQTAAWDQKTGDWNTYKGPMVSWLRVCSNGAGHPKNPGHSRFVLHGGKGFYQTYGFSSKNPQSRYQVIGYTPEGIEHTIENTLNTPNNEPNYPIHVPTPEISRVEVTVQKELFRRATIEWVCFSWKQLVYMTPYFLVPGISTMIEFGWNHFNPVSLVDLTNVNANDVKSMQSLWNNSYPLYKDNILNSKGNYDVIYGIITNFNWSVEGNKIICTTEVTSKDRLYAGISKDQGLTVKSTDKKQPNGIYQSLKDFVEDKDTLKNIKTIAADSTPTTLLSTIDRLGSKGNASNKTWRDIIRPWLNEGDVVVKAMKIGYVFGVFSGRPKENYSNNLGKPAKGDFDFTNIDNDDTKLWINVGLIIELINYFSALDGINGQPTFRVDILNTVIGGHINLISCDPRVLIPNSKAPKYHFGTVGALASSEKGKHSGWDEQYVNPLAVADPEGNSPDAQLRRSMYQVNRPNVCYRNDLDAIINRNRFDKIPKNYPMRNWSFPSSETATLATSPTGLPKNKVEKDTSGLLSNLYVSYDAFKSIVRKNTNASYPDIIKSVLELLMDASDRFWDLELVEVEGVMTITDKKYIGRYSTFAQGDKVYSFDYYDADSLIKSLKFRPALTDAQATRAIYGSTTNSNSKVSFIDKNDLLDYKFEDAVVFSDKEKVQGDVSGQIAKRSTSVDQYRNLVGTVQVINGDKDDGSLQMTVNNANSPTLREIVKLVLPVQQLLTILLDDKDVDNNPRYCAVQPGITLEMTILGIGGIRTFQYFLVKNLPEPYSERDVIFRVTDVIHTLESGNWETVIRAGLLPLRGYIKNRLPGPDDGAWPKDNR